jgi:hypothetical protein
MSVEPQLLLAQRVRPGPAGDFGDLVPLAGAAHAALPFERLVADAGHDSEANHHFCREQLRLDSLIPAKKRRSVRVVATTPYRQGTVRRLGEPGGDGGPAGPTGSAGRPRRWCPWRSAAGARRSRPGSTPPRRPRPCSGAWSTT